MNSCPSCEQIQQLLDERLSEPEREAIEMHIETCAACQGTLARLGADAAGLDWRVFRPFRPAPAGTPTDLGPGPTEKPPPPAAFPSTAVRQAPTHSFSRPPTRHAPPRP